MSIEKIRLNGMQSRDLELGRKTGHTFEGSKMTPTTEADISPRAQAYKRLVTSAVFHTMALEGTPDSPDQQALSSAALVTIRDEVRHYGFMPKLFAEIVQSKIAKIREEKQEEAEDTAFGQEVERVLFMAQARERDMDLIRAEFPNQFEPDYELQARMGEPPVVDIVNFGNHAFKKG